MLTLAAIFTLFVTMSTATKPNHIGYKIGRIRELRGLKQEFIAHELSVSQQTISKIEQSETVEDQILEQIAKILGVTPEGIKNFSEDAVFNIIGNNFSDNSSNQNNYLCTINPIEKIIQLYDEKIALLERLLQSEREKNELLKNK